MIHCAAIFTDHMLLQRGKSIAVFGTGTAGEPVTVSVPQRHCTVSSAVRQDGTWRVTLPPMPAGTGCTLTVNEQEFSDVAFGEVWLAGGQSNMEFMLKDARNGTAELEQCRNSNVRYFQVPRNTFADDAYTAAWNAARWELPDPETSGTWSAAAYLAAKELAQTQGVPVGIIGCNYGGSSVSCWLPESDLQAHAAGHPYLQDYADAAAGKTDAEMIAEYDEYVAYHTAWESRMQKCYQEDSNMPLRGKPLPRAAGHQEPLPSCRHVSHHAAKGSALYHSGIFLLSGRKRRDPTGYLWYTADNADRPLAAGF